MSHLHLAPVDRASLSLGGQLGRGGQGTVHLVRNKRINRSAPDGGWEVVYKEYDELTLPQLNAGALTTAVALLDGLGSAKTRWLCEKTAWPLAVVQREGQACGFLMRAAPDRFRFTLRALTGAPTGPERLATVEYLLNDDSYVQGIGLTVSDRDRLLLLADLAHTLEQLHRLGVAVGDVSPKNLLFSLAPEPECFLIDCDGVRLRGTTLLPQVETPDWQLPPGEERATPAGDVHKLGLLAVRLFARHQTSTDPAALTRVSPALGDLARASLHSDPARRPGAAVWAELLEAAAAAVAATASAVTVDAGTAAAGTAAKAPVNAVRITGTSGGATSAGTPVSTPADPAPEPPRNAVGKVLAGIAALVALILVVAHNQNGGGDNATPASSPSVWTYSAPPYSSAPYTPPTHSTSTYSAPAYSAPPYSAPPPLPVPSPSSNLYADASVGDCFTDSGTSTTPKLAVASCGPGTFKVLRINSATTDLKSCDGVTDNDESVSSSLAQRVLCLSYQSSGGTAYHARQNDCVFGESGDHPWGKQACQTGNFKVLARYRGNTDEAQCKDWPNYNFWRKMPVSADSDLGVLLCLSMNYPDDLGYATVNECLSKSGSTFTNVGSCANSNVYVTGRTGTYDDPGFCGQDGAMWWRSVEYPSFAYTVCWRWR
ncbi:hypothetical protein ABT095_02905 [Kitasatospora sp. NPDC002227]|uniref:LppU/SCO3897 family protein n=1 Tax=Kitasatospora sp. NPDC002227 TaxID=3154773 RepID=UPI0033228E93